MDVEYDPTVISLAEIFIVFFSIHDPTTLNRQGNDRGTQYRSSIFYESEEGKTEVRSWPYNYRLICPNLASIDLNRPRIGLKRLGIRLNRLRIGLI